MESITSAAAAEAITGPSQPRRAASLKRMRRAVLPVAALTVLVLAAGCGGSTPSNPPAARSASRSAAAAVDAVSLVADASTKTLAKNTSRVATTVVASSGLRLQSTGAYDYRRGSAVIDLTTTTSGRTTKQHLILVSGVAYLDVPGLPTKAKYIKLDLSALTGRAGGATFDQAAQLNLLRGATTSLHTVGSEPVRGVPTTHVAGTLDQRKALAALSDAKARAALEKLRSVVKTPDLIPVDAWIDGGGVLRRLKETVSVPAQRVAGISVPASTVTTTTEFYDFGVPVNAVAPPASAVIG